MNVDLYRNKLANISQKNYPFPYCQSRAETGHFFSALVELQVTSGLLR